jgi:hypothetical protein
MSNTKVLTFERIPTFSARAHFRLRDGEMDNTNTQFLELKRTRALHEPNIVLTGCKSQSGVRIVRTEHFFLPQLGSVVEEMNAGVENGEYALGNTGYAVNAFINTVRGSMDSKLNRVSFPYVDASPLDAICASPSIMEIRKNGKVVTPQK